MGFFTSDALLPGAPEPGVAIPFRVGWGFSHNILWAMREEQPLGRNPFQGGMGFFTSSAPKVPAIGGLVGRNPFQGGMGFFTPKKPTIPWWAKVKSQSLSGWDGVFH